MIESHTIVAFHKEHASMSVASQVRQILESEKDFKMNASVTDEDSLMDSGVTDSFGMITLIILLEQRFEIQINPEDLSQEDFRSIGTIAHYVEGRISGGNRD